MMDLISAFVGGVCLCCAIDSGAQRRWGWFWWNAVLCVVNVAFALT